MIAQEHVAYFVSLARMEPSYMQEWTAVTLSYFTLSLSVRVNFRLKVKLGLARLRKSEWGVL